jgi:hypothetical protein
MEKLKFEKKLIGVYQKIYRPTIDQTNSERPESDSKRLKATRSQSNQSILRTY